jgi:ATP-dependent exoDNAse (exonuclease V) alpha subunit
LIEQFSKRSEEIHEWLAEQGLSGIKASSAAAVATRAPKDHSESEQSVYARWARELAEQGVGERQLAEVCRGERGRSATTQEVRRVLEELASAEGLTAEASTFTCADVVDALAKRLPVARSATEALTQAEQAAERFLEVRAVRVARDRRLGVERFSTPELLALERQLVDGATQREGERCAVVRRELVRQVLDRHITAGEDQAAMVRDLTQGGDGVAVVVGRAGSGKTWALGLTREAFELAGYQVLGSAPTGVATVGLADEGFADARTIDRLLLDLGKGRTELDDRTVLVVDEAAMVATRKLAPLLQHAERAGAKVALVGDDRQFAPSLPAAASAPFASASVPPNSRSTAGRWKPGSSARSTTSGPATSSGQSPPMPSTTASAPSRPKTTATAPSSRTGGRRMRSGSGR